MFTGSLENRENEKYRVLIADDRAGFRKLLVRMKAWEKHPEFQITAEASNGYEVIEILKKESVDVILSDIRMPGMDGLTMLDSMKEDFSFIPVIFISDYAEFEYAQKALSLGGFDYLLKPVSEELLDRLLCKLEGVFRNGTYRSRYKSGSEEEMTLAEQILSGERKACAYAGKFTEEIMAAEPDKRAAALESSLISIRDIMFEKITFIKPFIRKKCFEASAIDVADEKSICDKLDAVSAEFGKFNIRLTGEKDDQVLQVVKIVMTNIENDKLGLILISNEMYLNSTYISQMFKKKSGMTLIKFIMKVKMEYAAVLLEDTDLMVYEISKKLGYESPDYFNQNFKKHYGMSASAYRQRVRGDSSL